MALRTLTSTHACRSGVGLGTTQEGEKPHDDPEPAAMPDMRICCSRNIMGGQATLIWQMMNVRWMWTTPSLMKSTIALVG